MVEADLGERGGNVRGNLPFSLDSFFALLTLLLLLLLLLPLVITLNESSPSDDQRGRSLHIIYVSKRTPCAPYSTSPNLRISNNSTAGLICVATGLDIDLYVLCFLLLLPPESLSNLLSFV